jgi:hypothetical protein
VWPSVQYIANVHHVYKFTSRIKVGITKTLKKRLSGTSFLGYLVYLVFTFLAVSVDFQIWLLALVFLSVQVLGLVGIEIG